MNTAPVRDLDAELAIIDAHAAARPAPVKAALAVMREIAPAYSSSDSWPVYIHVQQMRNWLRATEKDTDARKMARRSGLLLEICVQRVAGIVADRTTVQAALEVLIAVDQEQPARVS
jgi:hypothetical protein